MQQMAGSSLSATKSQVWHWTYQHDGEERGLSARCGRWETNGVPPAGSRGWLARTNPMRRAREGRPSPRPETLTMPASRGLTCQTKPIRAERQERQMLCSKRVMTNAHARGPGKTKPMCPARPEMGASGRGRLRRTNPICPGPRRVPTTQKCETNPNLGGVGRAGASGTRGECANRTRFRLRCVAWCLRHEVLEWAGRIGYTKRTSFWVPARSSARAGGAARRDRACLGGPEPISGPPNVQRHAGDRTERGCSASNP